MIKISIYRYKFPGFISDGRCHPYAGNVILLRFLFRACAYLPPAAQTRLRLRQWALMVAACLHVITKASQVSHILCTWMASFLCYFRHSFFLYIWFSLFILQWCPPGRAPRLPTSLATSPLPQIKYDKVEWKLKTPARRFYNHPLVLSRLKNFVKVPGYTGFCVDTENAAVWASASSAFSVSFLAKFCTPWYLRSSELRQIQRMIHKTPCPEFIYFKFPLIGNPLSLSFLSEIR